MFDESLRRRKLVTKQQKEVHDDDEEVRPDGPRATGGDDTQQRCGLYVDAGIPMALICIKYIFGICPPPLFIRS